MDILNRERTPIDMEITVEDAASLMRSDNPPMLLDVRELHEVQFSNLGKSRHIPTGEIQFHWESLPRDKHLLVLCHHGVRSLFVTRFLQEKGFQRVQSIQGGIEAWSTRIDQTVPRY